MVQIDLRQYLEEGKATLWLLLVGISHYSSLPSLKCAAADCQDLADAFRDVTQDFPKKEIHSYVGISDGEPVTLQQIDNSLTRIVSQSKPQDIVLFYFAGHGNLDTQSGQLYLCLTQTEENRLAETSFAINRLLQQFKKLEAKHQVVILDACHSGGGSFLGDSRSVLTVESRSVAENSYHQYTHPEFNQNLDFVLQQYSNQVKNFHALLSCGANEVSWETEIPVEKRYKRSPRQFAGAFSHALAQGIRGGAITNRGHIEIDSLYKFVRDETYELVQNSPHTTSSQTPYRVSVGNRDIVIGCPQPVIPTAAEILQFLKDGLLDSLTLYKERESHYYRAISGGLLREYPNISKAELLARKELARDLGLRPEKATEIELNNLILQRVEEYEIRVKEKLYESGQTENEIIDNLHTSIVSPLSKLHGKTAIVAMFDRIYQQIGQQFYADKKQYVTQYRQALQQYGNTQLKIFELRQLQQQIGFSDVRIQQFIQDEEDEFKQLKVKCSQDILKHLLEYGEIDEAAKARFQASSGLGVTIIDALIEAVQPEFEQRVRDFIEELQQELYNKGSLDE